MWFFAGSVQYLCAVSSIKTNDTVVVGRQSHTLVTNDRVVMIKLTNSELCKVNDTFYSSFEMMQHCYMLPVGRWHFSLYTPFIHSPSFKDSQTCLDRLKSRYKLLKCKNSCPAMTRTQPINTAFLLIPLLICQILFSAFLCFEYIF